MKLKLKSKLALAPIVPIFDSVPWESTLVDKVGPL